MYLCPVSFHLNSLVNSRKPRPKLISLQNRLPFIFILQRQMWKKMLWNTWTCWRTNFTGNDSMVEAFKILKSFCRNVNVALGHILELVQEIGEVQTSERSLLKQRILFFYSFILQPLNMHQNVILKQICSLRSPISVCILGQIHGCGAAVLPPVYQHRVLILSSSRQQRNPSMPLENSLTSPSLSHTRCGKRKRGYGQKSTASASQGF